MALATWVTVATIVAAASIAAMWWLAVPRHQVCTAIYPAGPGCPADREGVAALWTAIVTALYVVVVVALTAERTRRRVAAVSLAALTLVALWGYRATLYADAFGIFG